LSGVYHRIGMSLGWVAVITAAALPGSVIDIPVARLRAEVRQASTTVTAFGVTYRIPVAVRTGSTMIAVNAGGAIVPPAVAIYLICHDRLPLAALAATLIVTAVVFAVARPVAGVGIVAPSLVPPLVAALAAIGLGGHFVAAAACVAGTSGTLAGAGLLNLPRGPLAAGPGGIDRGRGHRRRGFPDRAGRRLAGVAVTGPGPGRACRAKVQRAAGPCLP
jgi:uncharacterized membrane protein